MSKNKPQNERDKFGKCEICLEYIPLQYYFKEGDTVVCYECGTEYLIQSKDPVKLSILEERSNAEDSFGELHFD